MLWRAPFVVRMTWALARKVEASGSQMVTLAGGIPCLGFQHWIAAVEPDCASDYGSARINSSAVDAIALYTANETSGSAHQVGGLSAHSGTPVNLQAQASPSPLARGTHLSLVSWDWVLRGAVDQEATWPPEPFMGILVRGTRESWSVAGATSGAEGICWPEVRAARISP
jgi:hypothetical protein